ncbi:MAG: CPBP family intramembrane glutamic endopeptidase [Spirochaetia bacterium]
MAKQVYIPWKVYIALAVLGLVGSAGVLPYLRQLLGPAAEALEPSAPFFLIALIQGFVLSTLLSLLGLLLASHTGMGVPVFARRLQPVIRGVSYEQLYVNEYSPSEDPAERGLARKSVQEVIMPVVLGLTVGIILVIVDYFVFAPSLTKSVADLSLRPEWWRGFLASFYGGIVEEILLRLFFLNLILLILMKITRRERRRPSERQVWTAIILSTLLFAAGHLPTVAAAGELSDLMIVRVMVLNSAAGIVFGLIFTRRGLLPAMASHFSADIVLHVIAAALL